MGVMGVGTITYRVRIEAKSSGNGIKENQRLSFMIKS